MSRQETPSKNRRQIFTVKRGAFHYVLKHAAMLLCLATVGRADRVVYTQGESTIDGKPFMPRGVYAVGIDDMRRAAYYGFNVIQNYGIPGMSDADLEKYMAAAARNRLKVLFGLDMARTPSPEKRATMERRVKHFKGHPALYGWYLADEPSVKNIRPQELEEIYNRIKKADPDHPVFSSNWELGNFKKACDADMRQLYDGGPARQREGALQKEAGRAAKEGVQWIAIANTYDSDFGDKKTPGTGCLNPVDILALAKKGEIGEAEAKQRIEAIAKNLRNPPLKPRSAFPDTPVKVRGQAFDMIAHGSNGIFYWLFAGENDINKTWGYYTIFVRPELRDALRGVLHEMDALWPRIASPAVRSRTWRESDAGDVHWWCRRDGKTLTIIAVNESETDHLTVTAAVSEIADIPEVVATLSGPEKKTVRIAGGKLTDTFRANEARVYLADLK